MEGDGHRGELKLLRGGLEERYRGLGRERMHCYSCGAPLGEDNEQVSMYRFRCSYCGRIYRIVHR